LGEACAERGIDLHLPSPLLCTDNGAMIAGAAVRRFIEGERTPWDAGIEPGLRLG